MGDTASANHVLRLISPGLWLGLATGTLLVLFGALCIGLPGMISSATGLPEERLFLLGVGSIVLGSLAELPFAFGIARAGRKLAAQEKELNPPIVR